MNLFRPVLLCFLLLPFMAWADWERLENCHLVPDPTNDGDSFLVKHGDQQTVFRLYFVDCPETDMRFPDRVKDQADYFGITPEQAIDLGHEGTAFTTSLLEAGPFIVWARGQSVFGTSRVYALVQLADGKWLDQELVRNGLARIYGKRITLPDGQTSREYRAMLGELREEAKREKLGGWKRLN